MVAMIDDDELLGKEADHRIRNSLQLVASLLQIQAGASMRRPSCWLPADGWRA